jgi:hypothetical protein
VTVGVKAEDQFGLNDVHLHYSVNGGPDRDVNLLKAPGEKSADGSYTLRLEDFKLVPGDLVSLYATAKDGHSESRTDITFIQADPFEREFSQSQQMGGGGGGGGQNNQIEISKREKELIAATWKQQNDKAATAKDAAATGRFLSDAQQKLRDQVMALSARMESRDLSEANEEFTDFEKDMQEAATAMGPSADKLKATKWKDAIPLEQQALQALLHAESTFRKIQVAFGQRGGGGGGTNSAGRDLASLFDLELDTEKNQYETAQATSPADQHQKDVEDALAKLDALAKRQEDLANQQHNPQQSFQERWQQEMLRREAEQLQRQMEQLAQKNQGQQQNGQQGSSGTSSGQAGSQQRQSMSSQNGSQNSKQQAANQSSAQNSDQQIQQALNRLRQAGEAMKRSNSQQNADAAREAADRLREATKLLGGTQQQLASGKLNSLSREADRLAQEERAQADGVNKLAGQEQEESNTADGGMGNQMSQDRMLERLRQRRQLAGERQELSDDLSKLQKNLRDTARELAPSQPGVSQKLRDALTEMDQSDLDNHVQRTADWLRGGINPNSNGTENEIAQGLQKLSQDLRQAQQGMGQAKPGQRESTHGDETATLDQVERLRGQLEAMKASGRSNSQQQGQNRSARDSGGQRSSGDAQQNNGNQLERNLQGSLQRDGTIGRQTGAPTGQQSGDVRYGGVGAEGAVWGNINTGNNRYDAAHRQPVPTDPSGSPRDEERFYQQGVHELNQLRQMVERDPEAAKQVQELTRQMQLLDPRRFPGNPEMVEQMHREVLSSLDRIELQLRRDDSSVEARTVKPAAVPEDYQDSVAEYYKRLSKNP